jgi:putative transposase
MPEHVHILVAPREPGVEVGRFIGSIKEKTARRAVSWLETNAPSWIRRITVWEGNRERRRFWQPGGGYDRNVRNETALVSMIEYIHANPVRRGLVRSPEDWEWSSAGWYAGGRDVPLAMDETLPFLTE